MILTEGSRQKECSELIWMHIIQQQSVKYTRSNDIFIIVDSEFIRDTLCEWWNKTLNHKLQNEKLLKNKFYSYKRRYEIWQSKWLSNEQFRIRFPFGSKSNCVQSSRGPKSFFSLLVTASVYNFDMKLETRILFGLPVFMCTREEKTEKSQNKQTNGKVPQTYEVVYKCDVHRSLSNPEDWAKSAQWPMWSFTIHTHSSFPPRFRTHAHT